MNQVLFICTGNFYRSRFAEALFNDRAAQHNLRWRAFSRGLAVKDQGDLSPHAREGLAGRGIALAHTASQPQDLSDHCLDSAQVIIALKEAEHRPLMQRRYPAWVDRISYWHVGDIDVWTPERTLAHIDDRVKDLLMSLNP